MIVKKENEIWRSTSIPTRHLIGKTSVNLLTMEHLWNQEGYWDVEVPVITEDQELIPLTDDDVKIYKVQRFRDLGTQEKTEKADIKTKQDKVNVYLQSHSTVGIVKTPDGTKDYAVIIGNDGKLSTIEIK